MMMPHSLFSALPLGLLQGGRRILWLSTSNDLRFDACRDISDMEAAEYIPVHPKVGSGWGGKAPWAWVVGGVGTSGLVAAGLGAEVWSQSWGVWATLPVQTG